jgi:CheY-like chemotaxis protein
MSHSQQINHQSSPKINKKILVAEDGILNQELVKNLLEAWDCEVDIAENGLEALNKIITTDYDLVLMDIQMPVMDGLTATREIRNLAKPGKSNLLILAFTSVDYGDIAKYREAGMNDYIIKPYTEETLYSKITNLLSGNKAETSDYQHKDPSLVENKKPKLYDLAMIETIGKNNDAFTSKMIVMFVDIVSQDFNKLKEEAAKENWVAVGQYAHKMKSTLANMSVRSALGFIGSLETQSEEPLNQIKLLEAEIAKVTGQIKSDFPHLF